MNPELKQRLIGAAVVTALATIFIPMLFDDPVDNTGQSVSELSIPAAPIKSTEVSANKLPTPANKTPKTPNTVTEGEPTDAVTDAEMVDDAEAEATTEPPVNESTPTPADAQAVAEEEQPPVAEEEAEPLDTGIIPEAKLPVKKPTTKPIKPVVDTEVAAKVKPVIKKTEANTPKLLPTTKPADVVAVVKPAIKKTEVSPSTIKPATPAVAVTPEKTAKPPELVRWTIHAGSFGQKDNATTLMKTLREQGIPVSIETIQSAKGPMYRLKIGPELDKKKAAANKAKLDKQGVNNVLIAE
ncbi:MAG: SPOR domain-containing protein [Methylococcaceae bacterium]|nr:SPOR domain-containing protein [Methylococcaceae bacterium]